MRRVAAMDGSLAEMVANAVPLSSEACAGHFHAYRLASPPCKKLGQTESGFVCVSTESGVG